MNKFEINMRSDTKPIHAPKASYWDGCPAMFDVTYTPVRSGIFNIWLFGGIADASQFIYAIEALNAATENDVVYINLSTNGGSLDATDTFLMAMQECQAKVIVKASGGVHSAGTVILMHADEFYLSENFNCLIHNGSTGAYAKTSDFVSQSKHTIAYMDRVMRETYAGFLTDDEIERLIGGTDFWFGPEEFAERFAARNELLAKEHEDAQKMLTDFLEQATQAAKSPAPAAKKVCKPKVVIEPATE